MLLAIDELRGCQMIHSITFTPIEEQILHQILKCIVTFSISLLMLCMV